MKRAKITKELEDYISEHLVYDKQSPTGLKWQKAPKFNSRMLGSVSGSLGRDGYYRVAVKRKHLMCHRVIWFLKYGYWPECIDHIDGNITNNDIHNLRESTLSQNQHNRINKGYKAVDGGSAFEARITVRRKSIYVGKFPTEEEAHAAYLKAKKIYHPTAPGRCYQ